MPLETPALWVAFALMLPLMIITGWSDLKHLKISNKLVLAVLAVFVATGLWGLPLETFLWRVGQGFVVLLIAFTMFQMGAIGGGDAKMASALTPFIAGAGAFFVLIIYTFTTIVLLVILRLLMQAYRDRETGWAAVDQYKRSARKRVFPMGLIFAITITVYLGFSVADSLYRMGAA